MVKLETDLMGTVLNERPWVTAGSEAQRQLRYVE